MAFFSALKDLNLNPLDTFSNLFKTGYSVYQDQRNFNYQKNLQKELFARDDTSMQRKMKDYSAAGINPLMALGSSGSSNTSAGGASGYPVSVNETFFSDQQKSKMERDTIQQEINKRKLEMEQMKINLRSGKIANWSAMQDLNTKRLEQDILKKQIEQMNNSGFYPISAFGKNYVDLNNLVMPILKTMLESAQYTYDKNFNPDTINNFKESAEKAAQNLVDLLGKPVFKHNNFIKPYDAYRREYEAKILRGSNDRNAKYTTHFGSTHKTGHIGNKRHTSGKFDSGSSKSNNSGKF